MAICTERLPVVAIIGAGLSGLTLALFLRAAIPIQITIFEARPKQAFDEGYLTLAPNACYQLDQLGLYDELLVHGHAYEDLQIRSSRGHGTFSIGSVRNGSRKQYGYPAVRISRHDLRQILLDEIDNHSMIEVRYNKKLTEIYESMDYNDAEENVFVRFTDGSIGGFDYVIGADGVHSRVRKVLSKDEAVFTGFVSIAGGETLRSSLPTDQTLPCMFLGRENDIVIAPTCSDGSRVSTFTTLEMDNQSQQSWTGRATPSKAEIIRLIRERYCSKAVRWPKIVQQLCHNMCDTGRQGSLAIWPLYHSPELHSRTTPSGRIILLGEAAHAMVGGQSAAMAFEDAASLAKVFGETFGGSEGDAFLNLPAALREWQSQREMRCQEVEAFITKGEIMKRLTRSQFEQVMKEGLLWSRLLLKVKDMDLDRVNGHREPGPGYITSDKKQLSYEFGNLRVLV